MNLKILKYILPVFILIFYADEIRGQITIKSFLDVGENNSSYGAFVKNVNRVNYQLKKFTVETGMQFDIKSDNPNTLTGYDILGAGSFSIRKLPLTAKAFFMLNRFSDLMHETNYGLRFETRKFEHFIFELGTNFKTYVINSEATDKYNINKADRKLSENFNLIYLTSAYLKPLDHDWNLGISCTNIDYYIINQSTNPVFNIQASYKIKPSLTVNMEAWYKQAGMFNISANYFGYFFRGGVIWQL